MQPWFHSNVDHIGHLIASFCFVPDSNGRAIFQLVVVQSRVNVVVAQDVRQNFAKS